MQKTRFAIFFSGVIFGTMFTWIFTHFGPLRTTEDQDPSYVDNGIYTVDQIFIPKTDKGPTFGITIMKVDRSGGYTLWGSHGLTFKDGISVGEKVIVQNGVISEYLTPKEKAERDAYNKELAREDARH